MRSFIVIGIILVFTFTNASANLKGALDVCYNRFKDQTLALIRNEIGKSKSDPQSNSPKNDNISILNKLRNIRISLDKILNNGYKCIEELSGKIVSDDERANIQTHISDRIVNILNECSLNPSEEISRCVLVKALEEL